MDRQTVKKTLSDVGVLEGDLAHMMGFSNDELQRIINKDDIPDDFLKKIEKTLGVENLFFMPEYGDNNTVGNNNNSNTVITKLLDTIKEQNETIKTLSFKLAEIAINNSKK